jgi:hypothetical protein
MHKTLKRMAIGQMQHLGTEIEIRRTPEAKSISNLQEKEFLVRKSRES